MCLVGVRAVETIKAASKNDQRRAGRCSFVLAGEGRALNEGLDGVEGGPVGSWR